MDNVTHALVGAAMAEVALPRRPSSQLRHAFIAVGVVAASAPDVDLVYTWITQAPLGYLLHHRGHTHTWPGLIALGLLVVGVCRVWPRLRTVVASASARLTLLVGAGLASHLLLDAGNVYGTHLLYPLTTRWYYGDAVFIFEPWLWLLLGTGVALNSRRRWTRRAMWAVVAALPTAVVLAGLLSVGMLVALAVGGLALSVTLRRVTPAGRAATVLIATAVLCLGMVGISRHAKQVTRAALATIGAGAPVDVVVNPNPGVPWCWSLLTLEHAASGDLLARRGTLSLLPTWYPAGACTSGRLLGGAPGADPAPGAALRWGDQWAIDRAALRALSTDCRVAAWLQFGRVPYLAQGRIVDLRFDNPLSANFTAMAVGPAAAGDCPTNLTNWAWPRADVLD